ncbi:MAG: SH3 domain-containing protein [Alphaproteobacteria bacterium]
MISVLGALAMAGAAEATPGDWHFVLTDGVKVRSAPDPEAAVVMTLNKGHKLFEWRRQGGWIKVNIYGAIGKEGWVGLKFIGPRPPGEKLPPPPAPEPAVKPKAQKPKIQSTAFVVEILGSPALRYRGDCRIRDATGERHLANLRGSVPRRIRIAGQAVVCIIQKWEAWGLLRVRLTSGGKVIAAARTRAPFNWIRVQSAGPWGWAESQRGVKSAIPRRRSRRVKPAKPMGRPLPPVELRR